MIWWQKLQSVCETIAPDCRAASRLQSEMLDHSLTASERFGLRLHLLMCQWCRRYGKQIRLLHEAAHGHQEELAGTVSQRLSGEARERMERRLLDNQASTDQP